MPLTVVLKLVYITLTQSQVLIQDVWDNADAAGPGTTLWDGTFYLKDSYHMSECPLICTP